MTSSGRARTQDVGGPPLSGDVTAGRALLGEARAQRPQQKAASVGRNRRSGLNPDMGTIRPVLLTVLFLSSASGESATISEISDYIKMSNVSYRRGHSPINRPVMCRIGVYKVFISHMWSMCIPMQWKPGQTFSESLSTLYK